MFKRKNSFFILALCITNLLNAEESMKRKTGFPIDSLFTDRWSPRAMSGEEISHQELMSLFEAARWAPSSYNNQPWRFVYAKRNTSHWDTLFNLMVPFNQSWSKNAAVLVVVISSNTFAHNGKFCRTHSFDTGSAWQNLALQGSLMGLVIHGMEGFDYDKAKQVLHIPEGYTVEAMIAIGKPGTVKNLPEDLQGREKPSDRKPVEAFVMEGIFTERVN